MPDITMAGHVAFLRIELKVTFLLAFARHFVRVWCSCFVSVPGAWVSLTVSASPSAEIANYDAEKLALTLLVIPLHLLMY